MRILKLPMRRVHTLPPTGYGIGSLFSRLGTFLKPLVRTAFASAKPVAKRTLKQLAKQGLETATSTALDVIAGEKPSTALKQNVHRAKSRVKKTLKTGMKRGASAVRGAIKAKQSGAGGKRRRVSGGKRRASKKKKKSRRRRPYRGIFQ